MASCIRKMQSQRHYVSIVSERTAHETTLLDDRKLRYYFFFSKSGVYPDHEKYLSFGGFLFNQVTDTHF
jgi:hypothetical protein